MHIINSVDINKILVLLSLLITLSGTHAEFVPRMVGGVLARRGEFPYLVSLNFNGDHHCGGSIISSRHVLTAAHCVVDGSKWQKNLYYMRIFAGSLDNTRPGRMYSVEKCFYPSGYNRRTRTSSSDIAVLKTASPIQFNEYTKLIPILPSPPPTNAVVTIAGWGSLYPSPYLYYPTRAFKADFRVVSHERCVQTLGNSIKTSQICTFNKPGVAACSGDSGSPVVYNGALVGIVSYGSDNCGDGSFDVNTSVNYFISWISRVTQY